jgi:hypothetical protein
MQALRKRPGDRPGAAEFGKVFSEAVAELPPAARDFRPPVASGPDLTDMATIAPNEPGSVSRMPRSVDFPTWSGEGQRFAGGGSITADPYEPDAPATLRGDELPTTDSVELPTLHGQRIPATSLEEMPTWRGDELPTRDGLDAPTLHGNETPTESSVRTQDSRLQTPDSDLPTLRGEPNPIVQLEDQPTLRGDETPTESGIRTPDSRLQTPDVQLPPKE